MEKFMSILWIIGGLFFIIIGIYFIEKPQSTSSESKPDYTYQEIEEAKNYIGDCFDQCLQYNNPEECIDASGEISSSINCPFNRCMDTCS